MWEKDFKKLRDKFKNWEIIDLIIVSQIEKNQEFYVRAKSLVDRLDLLREMVRERAKLISGLRAEFKKTLKKLEQAHGW